MEDIQRAAALACVAVEWGAVSVTIGEERCPSGAVRVMIVWSAGGTQGSAGGSGVDPWALDRPVEEARAAPDGPSPRSKGAR